MIKKKEKRKKVKEEEKKKENEKKENKMKRNESKKERSEVKENDRRKRFKERGKENERRERFKGKEKVFVWRKKVEEKKKEAEASTHVQKDEKRDEKKEDKKEEKKDEEKKIEKEEREKNKRGDKDNFQRTRVPFGGSFGSWHTRAPNGCWICGHPGHHRDECREEKGKDFGKKLNEKKFDLKEKRKYFSAKFCLVHGQCGHSTNECGDVQRALSPIKFFKRKPRVWFQQPQRRYFKEKPLDHRRKFFRYR